MNSIKSYCSTGRCAVMTIHQPREEIFSAFDTLTLLYRGGLAYFGGPNEGASFLSSYATKVQNIESYLSQAGKGNVADVVLDVLNLKTADGGDVGGDAVHFFRDSGVPSLVEAAVEVAATGAAGHGQQVAGGGVSSSSSSNEKAPRSPGVSLVEWVHETWQRLWVMESRHLCRISLLDYNGTLLSVLVLTIFFAGYYGAPARYAIIVAGLFALMAQVHTIHSMIHSRLV